MSGPKALTEAKKTVKPPKTPTFKTVPIMLPTNLYDELKEAANGKIGALVKKIVEEWLEARKND